MTTKRPLIARMQSPDLSCPTERFFLECNRINSANLQTICVHIGFPPTEIEAIEHLPLHMFIEKIATHTGAQL